MITAQKIVRLEPTALAPENRITAIAAGGHHSMALTVGGSILVSAERGFVLLLITLRLCSFALVWLLECSFCLRVRWLFTMHIHASHDLHNAMSV